jgi:shikimate 5-dehydrogenase/shikimate kinase
MSSGPVIDGRSQPRSSNLRKGIYENPLGVVSIAGLLAHDDLRSWLPPPDMPAGRSFAPDASIILVGLRGSGKRSLGFIASAELQWRFVTEDQYFEEMTGTTRAQYLRETGSQAFHKKNIEVMKAMLDRNRRRCVIECGLGSLAAEVQAFLRELCRTNPIIHVVRNMDHIRTLLRLGDTEAQLMARGDPTHEICTNFEYYNLYDDNCETYGEKGYPDRRSPNYPFKLKAAKEDFCCFVRHILGLPPPSINLATPFALSSIPIEERSYTFAVTLRLSEISSPKFDVGSLESCEDAVILKIDAFSKDDLSQTRHHIASIRRNVGVPIIYQVDQDALANTLYHASKRDQDSIRYSLMLQGLRLGVEFLVVGIDDEEEQLRGLISAKGRTRIIGHSFQLAPDGRAWLGQDRLAKYKKAAQLGCDVVQLTQSALSAGDNDDLREFKRRIELLPSPRPILIAYNVGELGKESMLSNTTLTPVSHLWSAQSIGSNDLITAKDAMEELFDRKVFDPLQFYVFGAGVSHSLAPAMYNGAYRTCGLRHDTRKYVTSSISDIWKVSQEPHFGGAIISWPFKVSLLKKVVAKSVHAQNIGAINTLIPLRASKDGEKLSLRSQIAHRGRAGPIIGFYGDNTDWAGLLTCITRNLAPRNVIQPKTTGLVIGAGGMARAAIYALLQLGCRKVLLYNRTLENAENVASHFRSWLTMEGRNSQDVNVLGSLEDPWPTNLSPATIIVSCIPAYGFQDVGIPLQWLSSPSGGLVIEVSELYEHCKHRSRTRHLCLFYLLDGIQALKHAIFASSSKST